MSATTPRHVLHVGYPKAGATFLKSWLLAHPQIRFEHGGVGGFRTIEEIAREADTSSDSIRCFATSSEELVAIQEASVQSAGSLEEAREAIIRHQETVCRIVATLFPGSRVLILTRGFMSMTRSSHSQYLKQGGWSWRMDDMVHESDALMLATYLDYPRVAALYESAFGADNVTVLPYELLRDDLPGFLRALEHVYGVDAMDFDPGRLNPSLTPAERYWYPRISERVSRVADRLPGRVGGALTRAYQEKFAMSGRLSPVVRLMDRVSPHPESTRPEVDAALRGAYTGIADALARRPHFARYANEYLFSTAVRTGSGVSTAADS
ncbi:MAG TPA: sulfotransferase [Rhodothermales bacterium]